MYPFFAPMFTLFRKEAVVIEPEIWPNHLNRCPFNGKHPGKRMQACGWNVMGFVTELCSNCVFEKEKELGSRTQALGTFRPDLTGNRCWPE